VDLGQGVYHGNYFHLLELAREEFLRDFGYPYKKFMNQEMHLALVEVSCSYRRALHYDELIDVHTTILWWRRRSLAFSQSIYRKEENGSRVLCTRATLNTVCIHFSGKATRLPEDFLELLGRSDFTNNHPSTPSP
jgi:acyl-CoA thioester hydrolase